MTDKKGLTTFQLKVFACLVMVIDHVSAIFMPFYDPMDSSTWPWAFALNNDILRGIGRLALPIFAFLIAEGCRHTRSLPRYCGRLFGFAVLSMVPYCFALFSQNLYTPRLVGDPSWYDEFLSTPPIWFFPDHVGNVLFSLAIGAAAVWLWNKLRPRIRGLVWIVLALYYAASLVIGIAFSVEYAEIIVPLVLGLYLLHSRRAQCLWLAAVMIVYYLGFAEWNGMGLAWVQRLEQLWGDPQLWDALLSAGFLYTAWACLAVIPVALYNGMPGKTGKWVKWGFYLFYPVHLLVLGGIRELLLLLT